MQSFVVLWVSASCHCWRSAFSWAFSFLLHYSVRYEFIMDLTTLDIVNGRVGYGYLSDGDSNTHFPAACVWDCKRCESSERRAVLDSGFWFVRDCIVAFFECSIPAAFLVVPLFVFAAMLARICYRLHHLSHCEWSRRTFSTRPTATQTHSTCFFVVRIRQMIPLLVRI